MKRLRVLVTALVAALSFLSLPITPAQAHAADRPGPITMTLNAKVLDGGQQIVSVTLDTLVFERDLLIQREVDLPISLNLFAKPGTTLGDVTTVDRPGELRCHWGSRSQAVVKVISSSGGRAIPAPLTRPA